MSSNPVTLTIEDRIATITFNRPEAMNTLDEALSIAFAEACETCAGISDLCGVILTGAGPAFMAGGDISDFAGMINNGTSDADRRAEVERRVDLAHKAVLALKAIEVPVIARINGACAGIGLSYALACDIAIAVEDAPVSTAYIGIGLSSDGGMSYSLTKRVGAAKAMELLLAATRLSGREAAEMGIFNQAVPAEGLDMVMGMIIKGLRKGPKLAIKRMKALVQAAEHNDLEAQLDAEKQSFADCAMTADFAEGVTAFLERRKPDFA